MKTLILILLSVSLRGQMKDDTKHFYAAFGIAVIGGEITNQLIERPAISSVIGAALGMAATILKEVVWDGKMDRGVKSLEDGVVGCMGAATGGMAIRVKFDICDKRKQKQLDKIYNYENR